MCVAAKKKQIQYFCRDAAVLSNCYIECVGFCCGGLACYILILSLTRSIIFFGEGNSSSLVGLIIK